MCREETEKIALVALQECSYKKKYRVLTEPYGWRLREGLRKCFLPIN